MAKAKSHKSKKGPKSKSNYDLKNNQYDKKRKSYEEEKERLYVVELTAEGFFLKRCDTRSAFIKSIKVEKNAAKGLKEGDIVRSKLEQRDPSGAVKDIEYIGHISDKDMINHITALENEMDIIYDKKNGLRSAFSKAALAEAKKAFVPKFEDLKGFEDLRDIPLMTIDPKTAKDFDDAVYARPRAEGGFHIITAIAYVAYYVTPGSALNEEAMKRGFTTYYPGIAAHMLPPELSEGVCSLVPHQERLCMAYHMDIDENGKIVGGYAKPAMMKSVARLNYEQAQKAFDGQPDEITAPLVEDIKRLYAASDLMEAAKNEREVLNIDKKKYEIVFDKNGKAVDIVEYPMYPSNKVIENFALAPNNLVGNFLAKNGMGIYRVHERPEKIEALVETLNQYGITLGGKGGKISVDDIKTPKVFNEAIEAMKQIVDGPELEEFKVSVLCSMKKAFYSDEELIHFGLQLDHYTHSTSPIRRGPDILATRMIIDQFNLAGRGITKDEISNLPRLAADFSVSERKVDAVEKDSFDRFAAQVFKKHVGEEFEGEIRHISNRGMLVILHESGVEGVIRLDRPGTGYKVQEDNGVRFVINKNSNEGKLSRGFNVKVVVKSVQPANGEIICEMVANDNKQKLPVIENSNVSEYKTRKDRKKEKKQKNSQGKHNKNNNKNKRNKMAYV